MWAKIISEIEFKFFYNSKKHNSVVEFVADTNFCHSTTNNKSQKILFKAYDDNADIIYSKYKKEKDIKIIGEVTNTHVEIIQII
jgi:hypothetical protein